MAKVVDDAQELKEFKKEERVKQEKIDKENALNQ